MESSFRSSLLDGGVDEDALHILVEQKICTQRVFFSMKEDHIVRLLECHGMSIGRHVLLWEMWERNHIQRVTRTTSSTSGTF